MKKLLLFGSCILVAVAIAMPLAALAIQPDAEYLVREKQFGSQWAAEDKQVQQKLAALEKKFGKKPNICLNVCRKPTHGILQRVPVSLIFEVAC